MVLDPQMRPFKYDSVKIDVIDINGKKENVINEQRTSNASNFSEKFSVFSGEYKFKNELKLGEWKIQVQVNSAKRLTIKKFFVAEETKKKIKIFMYAPNAISSDDSEVFLNIFAKDSFGNTVKDTVFTSATLVNAAGQYIARSKKALGVNGKINEISFNLRDDFGIQRISQNYTIRFIAKLHAFSDDSDEAEKDVKVNNGGSHYIVPELPRYFKAGMSYNFKAKVYTVNGDLEDQRGMQVIARAKFNNDRNREHSDSAILKNGIVEFNLPTLENAETMTLTLEIVNFMVENKIYAQKKDARILQVTVYNSK